MIPSPTLFQDYEPLASATYLSASPAPLGAPLFLRRGSVANDSNNVYLFQDSFFLGIPGVFVGFALQACSPGARVQIGRTGATVPVPSGGPFFTGAEVMLDPAATPPNSRVVQFSPGNPLTNFTIGQAISPSNAPDELCLIQAASGILFNDVIRDVEFVTLGAAVQQGQVIQLVAGQGAPSAGAPSELLVGIAYVGGNPGDFIPYAPFSGSLVQANVGIAPVSEGALVVPDANGNVINLPGAPGTYNVVGTAYSGGGSGLVRIRAQRSLAVV